MDYSTEGTGAGASKPRFGKTFLVLLGLGIPGILSLIPMIDDQLSALPPEMLEMPVAVVALLNLLNPLILTAISVAIGVLLAHRVGLRSLVSEKVNRGTPVWPELKPQIRMAVLLGLLFGILVLGMDSLIDPFAGTEMVTETPAPGDLLQNLVLGMLYGGVVEELMLRWGVMTLVVWVGWRIFQRGEGSPRPALVWGANILAALLFGIGHLPALAAMVTLTPLIIVRTVLLNAVGGILFGWLFWRRNLETAMVSHAAVHVAFFVMNAVLLISGG